MDVKKTLTEVAQEIAAEMKEVKEDAVEVVKKAVVELEIADKFLISQIESSFLKVQVELQQKQADIQRLQNLAKEIQEKFKNETEKLFVKYERDLKEDIIDVAQFLFRKRAAHEIQQ